MPAVWRAMTSGASVTSKPWKLWTVQGGRRKQRQRIETETDAQQWLQMLMREKRHVYLQRAKDTAGLGYKVMTNI